MVWRQFFSKIDESGGDSCASFSMARPPLVVELEINHNNVAYFECDDCEELGHQIGGLAEIILHT